MKATEARVLLTGATGFLGREILVQAAADRSIDELVAVVRPETIRDPKTRAVIKILSPKERGALLLKRLGIKGPRAAKFRFLEGDIEKALFNVKIALIMRPTYLEALRLRERIIAETDPDQFKRLDRITTEEIDKQEAEKWLRR